MAVHVFSVSEANYEICVENGIVGIPGVKDGPKHDDVVDGLLSRLSGIKEGDYVLMYITRVMHLCGVWQVVGRPFYDETPVWTDGIYPFRCRIEWSQYYFPAVLKLDDIRDLCKDGKLWSWALLRAKGANVMFSISDFEFQTLLTEFMKMNPFGTPQGEIPHPYPGCDYNILDQLHFKNDGAPNYEHTVMALLNDGFASGAYTGIFGKYADCLCYVPTSLDKEMDFLLMFDNPRSKGQVLSYDIIEVKRDVFDKNALQQLIGYESWFLRKMVSGDSKMVRTTAIAKSYSKDVKQYVSQRTFFENRPIKLLRYIWSNGELKFAGLP